MRLPLVVKFKMTYSKNEIKRRQLKFYADNYDTNYQFRREILKAKDIVNKRLLILLNLIIKNYSMKRIS